MKIGFAPGGPYSPSGNPVSLATAKPSDGRFLGGWSRTRKLCQRFVGPPLTLAVAWPCPQIGQMALMFRSPETAFWEVGGIAHPRHSNA
jgi:hypothetical protein